ncbi:Ig-like domain-containing protein, partial [bacterium]|nr:Ig-like domain-containing protein [bacterium]
SSLCSGSSTTVSVSGYTGTIQWQQSANGSTGWENVSGGSGATTATYTTPNLSATTYYKAVITSGACSSASSTTATITVNALPTVAAITGTAAVCTQFTTQLACSTAGGVWSSSDETKATVNSSGLVTGVAQGSAVISYTVTNGSGCSAAS